MTADAARSALPSRAVDGGIGIRAGPGRRGRRAARSRSRAACSRSRRPGRDRAPPVRGSSARVSRSPRARRAVFGAGGALLEIGETVTSVRRAARARLPWRPAARRLRRARPRCDRAARRRACGVGRVAPFLCAAPARLPAVLVSDVGDGRGFGVGRVIAISRPLITVGRRLVAIRSRLIRVRAVLVPVRPGLVLVRRGLVTFAG